MLLKSMRHPITVWITLDRFRDEIQYSPSSGKYTVYIIDEVHMLSIGAFNALLKTLEEPPAYVIFILATTEPHKIPNNNIVTMSEI